MKNYVLTVIESNKIVESTQIKTLIDQCIQGEREAQFHLYHQYAKAMYNVCFRMLNDKINAEDALQESFIKIFNTLPSYNYQSTLGAWIKRIVINTCIDLQRRQKMYFVDDSNVLDNVQEEALETPNINVSNIMKGLAKLAHGYRTIFSLYAIEGYDHQEIASILQISEETSKSQYHRARKKLKEIMINDGLVKNLME